MLADTFVALEGALVLTGFALLWHYGLSARARAAAREARLRADTSLHWEISASDFFLFLFCVIAGGLVAQALAALGLKLCGLSLAELSEGDAPESAAALTLLLGGAFHLGMLSGVLFFRGILRRESAARPAESPGGRRATRPRPPFLRQGLACAAIVLPVIGSTALCWQALLHALGIEVEAQDIVGIFADTDSPLLLCAMGFLAVVLAPITEELIFRAGLFRYLRDRSPRWVALTLPALLFAALHANLASFAPLTALGIVFALAYERSGTIAVPILAHALFNLNTIGMILAGIGQP